MTIAAILVILALVCFGYAAWQRSPVGGGLALLTLVKLIGEGPAVL